MLALQSYASSDDSDSSDEQKIGSSGSEELPQGRECQALEHYKPPENSEFSVKNQLEVCAAPLVLPSVSHKSYKNIA